MLIHRTKTISGPIAKIFFWTVVEHLERARHIICRNWKSCGDGSPLSLEQPQDDTLSGLNTIDEEEPSAYRIRDQAHSRVDLALRA